MKRLLAIAAAAALVLPLAPAALADEAEGEVAEIIIKIMTPDGPRWYRLGTDLSAIDVGEGNVVRFSYEEDTIEAIEVKPDDAGSGTTDN